MRQESYSVAKCDQQAKQLTVGNWSSTLVYSAVGTDGTSTSAPVTNYLNMSLNDLHKPSPAHR